MEWIEPPEWAVESYGLTMIDIIILLASYGLYMYENIKKQYLETLKG
jgi:hypothetical protein